MSRLVLSNDYLSLFYSFILFSSLRSVLIDVCYGPFIAEKSIELFRKIRSFSPATLGFIIPAVGGQIGHLTVKVKALTIEDVTG